MPEDIRIWEILNNNTLKEIKKSKLDLEEKLENWSARDISLLSDDLLVIGRQIETDFGGIIDLLGLDSNGDVVIVELKRDRTPREVTAQVLDYASWVKDLSNEKLTEIAEEYLGENLSLDEAFKREFGDDLPEILNENHHMVIVSSEIDSSTERIIRYLSDTYGVGINVVTFQYYRDDNSKEYLGRVFLIDPSQLKDRTQRKVDSKRRPSLSYEELEEISKHNGVGEVYTKLVEGLKKYFWTGRTRSSITFHATLGESHNTILSLIPGESSADEGLRFQVYTLRFAQCFGIREEEATSMMPDNKQESEPYSGAPKGHAGYFKDLDEVDNFLKGLEEVNRS